MVPSGIWSTIAEWHLLWSKRSTTKLDKYKKIIRFKVNRIKTWQMKGFFPTKVDQRVLLPFGYGSFKNNFRRQPNVQSVVTSIYLGASTFLFWIFIWFIYTKKTFLPGFIRAYKTLFSYNICDTSWYKGCVCSITWSKSRCNNKKGAL